MLNNHVVKNREMRFSISVGLIDDAPRFVYGKGQAQRRIDGTFLRNITREFKASGKEYTLEIQPARIRNKEGVEIERFAGLREELVEETLRMLSLKKAKQGEECVELRCSIYELQRMMKETGHLYSYRELRDALRVISGCLYSIKEKDKRVAVENFRLIEAIGIKSEGKQELQSKITVSFPAWFLKRLHALNYMKSDYDLIMSFKNVYELKIYKRIILHWKFVENNRPYNKLGLMSFLNDAGITPKKRLSENIRHFQNACCTLAHAGILSDKKTEFILPVYSRNGRKVIDGKINLYPGKEFVEHQKQNNTGKKLIQYGVQSLFSEFLQPGE